MMPNSYIPGGTKICPFCAEEIKGEALKCRFCGEMLGGTTPVAENTHTTVYETKIFFVPFPKGSLVRNVEWTLKLKGNTFNREYFREIGVNRVPNNDYSFEAGATYVWEFYKNYFLERINDLGREGWVLAEPFDPPKGLFGYLSDPVERIQLGKVVTPGLFRNKELFYFDGCKFMMRRTTL